MEEEISVFRERITPVSFAVDSSFGSEGEEDFLSDFVEGSLRWMVKHMSQAIKKSLAYRGQDLVGPRNLPLPTIR